MERPTAYEKAFRAMWDKVICRDFCPIAEDYLCCFNYDKEKCIKRVVENFEEE